MITTMDGLVSAIASGQDQLLYFPSGTTVAGGWINLNYAGVTSFGQLPQPLANTVGGNTYVQSTTAANVGYPKWTANATTNTYISLVSATFVTAGTIHIYDVHWACSGFNGTVATAQAVTSFSGMPARNPTGVGCEIWLYDITPLGATGATVTCQYTNSANVISHATVSQSMIASMPANRMLQLPLQNGDLGVANIASVTLSGTTGTVGNFGVLIAKRIASISAPLVNVTNILDFAELGLPQISDTSTLMFVHQGTATSSGIIMGQMIISQG